MEIHGTSTSYGKGCRCDICRAGRAAYQREWKARNPGRWLTSRRICDRCGKEFLAAPTNKQRPGRFCSRECAGTAPGTGKRPHLYRPGHPLAGKDGRVMTNRMMLYDAIGPGPHPCHWCEVPLEWVVRTGRGSAKFTDLVADHLDADKSHNLASNLVPSCQRCNILRGQIGAWEKATGGDVAILSHHLYPIRAN